jgi:hypothetical protein
MTTEIFIMMIAFLFGGMTHCIGIDNKILPEAKKLRKMLYQGVIIYLLFRIGFKGGESILAESFEHVFFTSSIAVVSSVFWTVILLYILKWFSPFSRLTQISIATHFGSVSVGTFLAGIEFLSSMGIKASGSAVVWLAIMELPALFVGVIALHIRFSRLFQILKKDTMLWILISAIFLGILGSGLLSNPIGDFFLSTMFLPLLAYFLFEMGAKASANIRGIKNNYFALFAFGIGIPFVGGIIGACIGALFGYSAGDMFLFSILMASASYVLVPISFREILKSTNTSSSKYAEDAIATGVALSVGITLPFNILIGFEIFFWWTQALIAAQ